MANEFLQSSGGGEGLYDRRLSARRAGVDEVPRAALFDTRYWDFTAKHFWEKLVDEHGVTRSGAHDLAGARAEAGRGAGRTDASGPAGAACFSRTPATTGEMWDLVVTLDDATSEVYSLFRPRKAL